MNVQNTPKQLGAFWEVCRVWAEENKMRLDRLHG
jgi:hypothetical protein